MVLCVSNSSGTVSLLRIPPPLFVQLPRKEDPQTNKQRRFSPGTCGVDLEHGGDGREALASVSDRLAASVLTAIAEC